MESSTNSIEPDVLSNHIEDQLRFHRRWRRATMVAYVFITSAVVTASTSATIISALNGDIAASICAGVATIFIGVDKSLMFKEKWRLHVAIVSRLEALKLSSEIGEISLVDAARDIAIAIERYADELPFPTRD